MTDAFIPYETGLTRLLELLGSDHSRYAEALTLQSRLLENISQARQYGDTETRRAERAQTVDALNQLAMQTRGSSFNELCNQIEPVEERHASSPIANALRVLELLIEQDSPALHLSDLKENVELSDEEFKKVDTYLLRAGYVKATFGPDGLRWPTHEGVRFWQSSYPTPASPPSTSEGRSVTISGINAVWQRRLRDLANNIAQDLALLKEYEDALRYEDAPRRRARYRQEIEQLRESAARHQQEYDELQAQVIGELPAAMQGVASQLQQMDAKLDTLLSGQTAIHDDLSHLRQALLARYEAGEQVVIATIAERLDQAQLATVQAILNALEADQLSEAEMRQALDAVQRMLVALSQRGAALPDQQAVTDAIAAPTLAVKHKLKITLPIIPLLLGYEGELELGSEVNLEAVWRQLITRVRGG